MLTLLFLQYTALVNEFDGGFATLALPDSYGTDVKKRVNKKYIEKKKKKLLFLFLFSLFSFNSWTVHHKNLP